MREDPVVVTSHRCPGPNAEALKLAVAQVPAQLPIHMGGVGLKAGSAHVGGQYAHLMSASEEMLDRRAPYELITPVMVGRVHVTDGQGRAPSRG